MAKGKKKPYSDKELSQYLRHHLRDADEFASGTLSTERKNALDYYDGKYPNKMHEGSSSYRSLDVFEGVESARSSLLEVFTGNKLPLEFKPTDAMTMPMAAFATNEVNSVVFTENEGFPILDTILFDGFTARIGIMKVYTEKRTIENISEFEGLPDEAMEEVLMLSKDVAVMQDDGTGLWSGEITETEEVDDIKIDVVVPEDFVKSTDSESILDGPFAHRVTKRLSVWMSEGYKEDDLVKALGEEALAQYSQEKSARNTAGSGWMDDDGSAIDPEVTLLEAYAKIDINRDGKEALWKFLLAGPKILEKDEVDSHPFVLFTPIPVAHTFYGSSYASKIIPTQNAKSTLTRSIIDHSLRTNNVRYTVLSGTVDSARELLQNKLGGIVNVKKPDGIKPLEQPPLNPFTFQLLGLLDQDKDNVTGFSQLAKGIDKEAVSKQNSAGMIQELANMSQQRMRVIARRFAENTLKPLAEKVYTLLVATGRLPAEAGEWPAEARAKVELSLSVQDRELEAGKLTNAMMLIAQDPAVAHMLEAPKKREIIVRSLQLMGVDDAESWLNTQAPPPPPDPMQEVQIQQAQQTLEINERQTQIAEMKARTDQMEAIQKLDVKMQEAMLKHMEAEWKMQLETRKQVHAEYVAERELDLAEAAPDDNQNAMYSAN
jgi:hypothetical protein